MISEADLAHLATLARLRLRPEEIGPLARQLAQIVAYVRQLQEVPTAGVEPLINPLPADCPLREDQPQRSLSAQEVLANAPQRAGGLFKVPPVLDASTT